VHGDDKKCIVGELVREDVNRVAKNNGNGIQGPTLMMSQQNI